ncbi:hypothetical protein BSZ37_12800 [Rubrivirga marina]|uniref:Uncharacterized protein n=1 Tax=Rubrivirga marina TaxID=1196024 RepID=A0A271J3G4_9BACT|nr:hypothetical protein BSZ37_12800 [Rubrivirga marina]
MYAAVGGGPGSALGRMAGTSSGASVRDGPAVNRRGLVGLGPLPATRTARGWQVRRAGAGLADSGAAE